METPIIVIILGIFILQTLLFYIERDLLKNLLKMRRRIVDSDMEYKKKKKARTYDPLCSGDAILSKMKNNDPLDRKISSNLITLFDL